MRFSFSKGALQAYGRHSTIRPQKASASRPSTRHQQKSPAATSELARRGSKSRPANHEHQSRSTIIPDPITATFSISCPAMTGRSQQAGCNKSSTSKSST
ncbi:hypothetical protein Nepgr_014712 [Nepenthes gracilis]|uniref:Uncharacterized protein n=1 Tax=Nepenthes gracilis TaxID=150966 RepID=A0AAD3XQL3_NEPGR|nr:hypothetical protein Nepgr_014712 [Nepenthes gracilis]